MAHSPKQENFDSLSRIPVATGLKVAAILLIVNLVALASHIYFQTVLWYSSDLTSGTASNHAV